jgi:gliding motility-associated-like protein
VPIDNVPPCKPTVDVIADCDKGQNELTWNNPNNSCAHDVKSYEIWYYTPLQTDPILVATKDSATDTTYIHPNLSSNTGCYSIVAVDSAGNKSPLQPFVCIDSCHQYYLPNVFTPDNDGMNDVFHPCDQTTATELQKKCPPYKNVKDVIMKIYNRWGNLVFETTNRDIDWDGKNKDSHKDCPDGVYYYICEVHEIYLEGIRSHTITGFVEIIRKP